MQGIINGTELTFVSKVTVPVEGNKFATLKFTDTLDKGLGYLNTPSAMIQYKKSKEDDKFYTEAKTTVNYDEELNTITLLTTDTNITSNETYDIDVRAVICTVVRDADSIAKASPLVNEGTFSTLDANGVVIDTATGTATIPVTNYGLFVMGVPRTIAKTAGTPLPEAVYFFGAMIGRENDNIRYNLNINKNQYFDFDLGTAPGYSNVKVYPGEIGTVKPLEDADRTVNLKDDGSVEISFAHIQEISGETVHVVIPTTASTLLNNDTPEPQFITGDANVTYKGTIQSKASEYNVEVTFTGKEKQLENVEKILVM